MPGLSFAWLNDGKEFDLPDLPIAGKRDVLEYGKQHTEVLIFQHTYRALYFAQAAIAAQKILAKFGVTEAKTKWDATMHDQLNIDAFTWSEEDFEDNLNATVEEYCIKRLGCTTLDEGKAKLEELANSLQEQAKTLKNDPIGTASMMSLIELYWRLRSLREKVVKDGDGELIEVSWKTREAAIDALSLVVSEEDLKRFSDAKSDSLRRPDFDADDLSVEQGDVVRKN